MEEDEQIDFEQVLNDEYLKQKQQEKKDEELALKLLADDLDRQEQEQLKAPVTSSLLLQKWACKLHDPKRFN